MKMKDSRLIGSVYRVDSERIVGINLGHDMICYLSKLLTGNRNKMDSIEISTLHGGSGSNGYDILILRDDHRFELFIPKNKINYSFNIPKDAKPKTTTQEEPVEDSMSEEIETAITQSASSTPVEQTA